MASVGGPLLVVSVLHAQVTPTGFAPFKHVRAAADDGAPDGILRITQTADGYLWFAGDALYRFDGATFEMIDWPRKSGKRRASPSALMVGNRGELWVGMRDTGGVAVYRNGALHDMRMPDPPRGLAALTQAPDGTIWASSLGLDKRLQRLRGSHWEEVDKSLALPAGYIMDVIVAQTGGLWIALSSENGESGSLAFLAPHATQFRTVPARLSARPKIALDRNGALWASDAFGTRLLFDVDGTEPRVKPAFAPVPDVKRAAFAFDHRGGIWGTTSTAGIFHIPDPLAPIRASPSAVHRFSAANGLTSDVTYVPFVDREGNIWIGTESGIDQFRRASAVQAEAIPPDPVAGLSIAVDRDGTVYMSSRRILFRVPSGGAPKPVLALQKDEVSLCPARDGGVWIIEAGRTILMRNGRALISPGYPGDEAKIACVEDRRGRLWLGLISGKFLRRDANGWKPGAAPLVTPSLWDLTATPSGDLAFITPSNLSILRDDRIEVVKLQGSAIGTPWAILPGTASGSNDLFVSGSSGLLRLRGNRLRYLNERRFPWITWVRSLQQTKAGQTWLFSRTGVYRVATAALDRAFDDRQAPLAYTKFDALDGLASTVQSGGYPGAQSAVAGDQRIWFLNRQGAAFLDPAQLRPNRLPPPVTIRSLTSGGETWRDPANLVLPAGTRTVTLSYAGLSFTVPQRVRFQYRLQGAEERWVDAGARRTASYSNLGPGHYRFRVIATNNDGFWNRTGAVLDFEIRPTFFQSWPFRILCGVAVLVLMWLAYTIRLRAVARRIGQRLAERVEERERIARELHDTLLQAIQSLTLRFQLAADDLPHDTPVRTSLIEAIDTADRVIADGRDRVRELRSQQEGDLEKIICDLIARLELSSAIDVALTVTGTPRRLDPLALEEVTRIASEALFNIRQHASATRLSVEIRYGSNFTLCIADDGVGIELAVAANGGKAGHYGLVGMMERARKLRGTLDVRPGNSGGTQIILTLPGSIAYGTSGRSLFARVWRAG